MVLVTVTSQPEIFSFLKIFKKNKELKELFKLKKFHYSV